MVMTADTPTVPTRKVSSATRATLAAVCALADMGLISPTPRQGSWVECDAFSGPWTPQPRQGSWVTMDGVTFDPWVPPTDGWSVGFLKF